MGTNGERLFTGLVIGVVVLFWIMISPTQMTPRITEAASPASPRSQEPTAESVQKPAAKRVRKPVAERPAKKAALRPRRRGFEAAPEMVTRDPVNPMHERRPRPGEKVHPLAGTPPIPVMY